ncbi:hypothetical protein D3C72_1230100 [compost metagenome]
MPALVGAFCGGRGGAAAPLGAAPRGWPALAGPLGPVGDLAGPFGPVGLRPPGGGAPWGGRGAAGRGAWAADEAVAAASVRAWRAASMVALRAFAISRHMPHMPASPYSRHLAQTSCLHTRQACVASVVSW